MKLVVTAPRISGVRTTPDDVAEVPITPWTKSGTKLIVPNIAAPTSAMHATLEATVWLRSRSNGIIGSTTRRSISPKAAIRMAAARSAPTTAGEDGGAEPVDRVLLPDGPARHRHEDHGERETADRQVDVEDPAPARVVDNEPTDKRADDRGAREDRADQPLIAPAVPGRDDHPDHREGQREDPSGSDALNGAEDDQLPHVLRRTAEGRTEEEDHDRDDEEGLAAVDVAQLPVQRHGHGRAEHVRGEDPRVLRDPAEVGDDLRQRRCNDRLVERGEQQRHHQPGVDREDPPDRELVARRLAGETVAERHSAGTCFPSRCVSRAARSGLAAMSASPLNAVASDDLGGWRANRSRKVMRSPGQEPPAAPVARERCRRRSVDPRRPAGR